jgi:3-oxoacyl-(acyl-carrier-protein) synthase
MKKRRVVITGIGLVTPIGVGIESFWRAASAGTSGTRKLKSFPLGFRVDTFKSQVAAVVPDEWLLPVCPSPFSNEGRHFLLGSAACSLACEDAGVADFRGTRSAVVLGNAIGGTAAMEDSFLAMDQNGSLDPDLAPGQLHKQMSFHSLTHELAMRLGCDGPALTISTGCTAGMDSVATAFDLIRYGSVDVALTGGSEAPISPVVFAAFDVISALTQRNWDPEHASRPFDATRDGFVLGEGAALLLLEEREQALRRNARIYAEIVGFASVSNAFHMTDLPPDGLALAHCVRLALDDAGLRAEDIDAVNAHGSSTPQNDICETNALKEALGDQAHRIPVTSLKSMIGHALGASNAIEMGAATLCVANQFVYPTANLELPAKGCDLDYVPKVGRPVALDHVLKVSNGFSGVHSALVLAAPN